VVFCSMEAPEASSSVAFLRLVVCLLASWNGGKTTYAYYYQMRSLKEHPVELQKIVAELDATDATQRHISEVITRTHFGRNPTWKSISARRDRNTIN